MTMKYRLMAPGPTPVPEPVLTEMAKPILHHRTPQFSEIFAKVQEQLKWLYQTKNDVLMLASSGSGAMEASLVNTLSTGDEILVVNGGKFGERFAKIAQAYGVAVDEIAVEWGQAVSPQVIQDKLSAKTYRAVCVQASETSTGVAHPIEDIAKIVKAHDETLLVVDAITALGVTNLPVDDWGLDLVICGSQKALMLPPGLATLSVSEKAWKFVEQSNLPKFYFDLKAERKAAQKHTTSWTPAVSLIIGLHEALNQMQAEGLENMFKRHTALARSLRNAAQAIGLKPFAPENPSTSVTALYAPEGVSSSNIVAGLRDKFQMTIADGQNDAKGKIFRIGHLGYYDLFDMVTVWSAVEKQLSELGYSFELGKGVAEIIKELP